MGVVTEGIIAMPYELAMADELTRMQFYQTVTSEIATLRARLETVEAETRERCAKAAEQRYTRETVRKSSSGEPYAAGKMAIFAASTIAAAIRNLEPRHD